jgi:uncharacterized UPF0160 family protein
MKIIDDINTIAVHDGTFHADDVFAAAILLLTKPAINVIRTRDTDKLAMADLRIDVGGKYSPKSGDYDHHMAGGAGKRANGVPYAACGLIWKNFGMLMAKTDHVFEHIERRIILSIDAIDSGYSLGEDTMTHSHYLIADATDAFNPAWNDSDQNLDAAFMRAVSFAQEILSNEIRQSAAFESGRDFVYTAIQAATDPRFIILDRYCPWQDIVINETDALYVLFPSATGDWRIRAVPERIGSFAVRKPLPSSWGGKSREELAALTGVSDAVFCHQSLFIAGAVSKEGTIKMLEIALN